MKSSTALSILATVAVSLVGVRGDAVSCSVIDYLYYSSDCCDSSNSVQCMESIPQTDKAAIDNLASIKRADGTTACQDGDTISYAADTGSGSAGIVCTASGPAVDCVFTWSNYSSCVNGEKTRTTTVSTPASGAGAACPASPETAVCTGAIGDACTDNAHCDSSTCDIGTTNKCVAAFVVHETYPADYSFSTILTEAQCKDLYDNHRHDIGTELGVDVAALEAGAGTVEYSDSSGSFTAILGCSVQGIAGSQFRMFFNDGLKGDGSQGDANSEYKAFTQGADTPNNYAVLLHP